MAGFEENVQLPETVTLNPSSRPGWINWAKANERHKKLNKEISSPY